jgi:8-oxo-dGTP pyrophosphatase MutT (NUDIX family)
MSLVVSSPLVSQVIRRYGLRGSVSLLRGSTPATLQLHSNKVLQGLKERIYAGGPGSGRHPGFGQLQLPSGVHRSQAKAMPLHTSWVRHRDWRQQAYGGVLVDSLGRFLLRQPTNKFDGYAWTFPKGKMDNDREHPVDVAKREVAQETGFHTKIFDAVPGTYKSDSGSHSSFYLMRPNGQDPELMDKETQGLRWANYKDAVQLISQSKNVAGRERDLAVLQRAQLRLNKYRTLQAGGPGSGCRGPNCGRPALGKKDVPKFLTKLGWTQMGKAHTQAYDIKKVKTMYQHPAHGKLYVGNAYFYHENLGNKQGTGVIAHLPAHLGQTITPKVSTPASTPTTIYEQTTGKPGNVPKGMAEVYKSNASGNIWTWNKETGLYHSGPGQAKWAFDKVADKEAKGTFVPDKFKEKIGTREVVTPTVTAPVKSPEVSTTPIPKDKFPSQDQLTYKGSKQDLGLGGAHEKWVFTDKAGKDYMFKPAQNLDGKPDPMKAYVDQVAGKVQEALRPGFAVPAKAVTMDIPGKGQMFGSLQQMVPKSMLRGPEGKYQNFVGRDINTLQPWEVEHLQQEQVVDWLISNHDSHEGQFLRVSSQYPGGRGVLGIDLTQAFRYFPNDKLSMSYQPNTEQYGEKPPIYNAMWQAVKDGKLSFDPDNTLKTIKAAEGISDKDYEDMLRPYAASRFDNTDAANKFLDQAVDRKHNLRADFEGLISEVTGNKFKFGAEPTGEHVVKVPYPYATNPDPEFKQTVQSQLPAMHKAVGNWLETHGFDSPNKFATMMGYGKGPNLANYTDDSINKWQQGINQGKTPVEAAKGLGIYPEMAAKFGLGPEDIKKVQSAWDKWSGSTMGGGEHGLVAEVRKAAQEVTSGKCCTGKLASAVELEHAITRGKLNVMHPDGYVNLKRHMGDEMAMAIGKAKKMAATVTIKMLNAEGWSDNGSFGKSTLKSDTSIDHIVSCYKTNPSAWSGHYHEHEYAVAFPGIWDKHAAPGGSPGVWRQFKASDILASVIIRCMGRNPNLDTKNLGVVIDLTNPVDANWMQILRENPKDPRFQLKPGMPPVIDLGDGLSQVPGKKRTVFRNYPKHGTGKKK